MAQSLLALRRAIKAKPTTKKNFRADIQGLRAVAVIAVILDHLLGWPSGGFVGVDVFFVISGFLITGLLLREHDRTGNISFSAFYRNRLRRIAPAATLVLATTVLVGWLVFNQARFISVVWDSVWAFFFTANWHYAAQGTDYFQASGPESPLQHFWSLAVEEQFYFVWPWLMLLVFVLAGKRSQSNTLKARSVIGMLMAAICVASFAWSLSETANSPTWAYFSTFSRAWELGVGALIAVFAGVFIRLPARARTIMAYAGLAGIIVSLFVITETMAFPGPWAALPVLATAAVIISGTGGEPVPVWPLTNRVSGYLGNISYSLYLWHFPVIIFFTSIIGDSALDLAICAVLMTVLSIYSFHLVEDPIRRSNWLVKKGKVSKQDGPKFSDAYKMTALSLLAVLTATVVWAAAGPGKESPYAGQAPAPLAKTNAGAAGLPETVTKMAALQEEMKVSLAATEWPTLAPSIEEVIAGPQASADIVKCGRGGLSESECTWGDPKATRTILTVGNSLSMNYVTALRAAIGTSEGWRIVSYGMFGCPFGDAASTQTLNTIPVGCEGRSAQAIEAINRLKPEVVILAGTHPSAVQELTKVTAPSRLVFMLGAPIDKSIEECYTKLSKPADCVGKVRQGWGADEKARAGEVKNGIYVDTVPWFCFEGSCPAFVGKIPMKKDEVHMSSAYAERLGPVIRETLRDLAIL